MTARRLHLPRGWQWRRAPQQDGLGGPARPSTGPDDRGGRALPEAKWQNLQEARAVRQSVSGRRPARQQDAAEVLPERNRQIASGEPPVEQFTHNEQRSVVESHGTWEIWRRPDFYRGRLDRQGAASGRQSR
jgi:hypothetical protein